MQAVSNLLNLYTFSSRSLELSIPTTLNVIRQKESVIFRKKIDSASVACAIANSDVGISTETLRLFDKSGLLPSNRIANTDINVVVENDYSYTIESDLFLVTDVFTEATSTNDTKPLYYKHVLDTIRLPRVSSTDLTINTSYKLVEVVVLDKNFEQVIPEEFKIDYDQGIVYSNLINVFDTNEDDLVVYYLKYRVRTGNLIVEYIDILDNQKVFRIAEFDDLDSSLSIINDGRKVYLLEELSSSNFNVSLPEVSTYAFRIINETKLQIIKPLELDLGQPWNVNVTNASIYSMIGNTVYKYTINEFSNQAWNPQYPYKRVLLEESYIVSPSLIKTSKSNLYLSEDDEYYLDVLIDDQDGEPIAAFTTDSNLVGTEATNGATYQSWSLSSRIGIHSIDRATGLIKIEGVTLSSNYSVYSSFYYEEQSYAFGSINFNPLHNPDILNQTVVLFIDPNGIEQNLFYLIVDRSGQVIRSNWTEFDNDTQTLTSGTKLFYKIVPDYVVVDTINFKDVYSIEGGASGVFFVLGELSIDSSFNLSDIHLLDARVRGGGIQSSLVAEAKVLQPEVDWYWDIGKWDGKPYPGKSSFFVEIPVEILDGAGGIFRQNEIKKIVQKHASAGTYGIVKAYGRDPIITNLTPESSSILVEWDGRPNLYYNVYYSSEINGPWTLVNVSPIAYDANGNSQLISGLLNNVEYFIYVAGGTVEDNEFTPLVSQSIDNVDIGALQVPEDLLSARTFAPRAITKSSLEVIFEFT